MPTTSIFKIVLISCLLTGCDSDNSSTTEGVNPVSVIAFTNRDENTYYEQVLPDGAEECSDEPLFNCTADLYLCRDGSAKLTFTDIINDGFYVEFENQITSSWGPGDAPPEINFEKQADLSIIDDFVGFSWTKQVSEFTDDFCEP